VALKKADFDHETASEELAASRRQTSINAAVDQQSTSGATWQAGFAVGSRRRFLFYPASAAGE
jgi:hypothetical protein